MKTIILDPDCFFNYGNGMCAGFSGGIKGGSGRSPAGKRL